MFDRPRISARPVKSDPGDGVVTVTYGAGHSISWIYDPENRKTQKVAHEKADAWRDGWQAREAAFAPTFNSAGVPVYEGRAAQ